MPANREHRSSDIPRTRVTLLARDYRDLPLDFFVTDFHPMLAINRNMEEKSIVRRARADSISAVIPVRRNIFPFIESADNPAR